MALNTHTRLRLPRSRSATILAVVAATLCVSACSLVLGLGDRQACGSDSDCKYTDGQGQCVGGFCEPPGPSADDTDGDGPVTMNDDTDDMSGVDSPTGSGADDTGTSGDEPTSGGGSSSETSNAACTVNSECDEDFRCGPGNACLALLSQDCTILQYPDGQFDRDEIVFLGSIMPTGAPFDEIVVPLQNATQLAIEDFNNTTNLPGNRQIAWVGCDSTDGAAQAQRAAEHLTGQVGARAIVGPVFSESVIQVAEQVTVAADTFVITPTGSAELITGLADDNLVWRVTPSDVYQSEAIADRIVESAPARLLVLAKDDAYGNGILNAIQAGLVADLPGVEIFVSTYENPANFKTQAALLSSYGAVLGAAFDEVAANMAEYNGPEDHYTHVLILGTSEAEALIVSYLSVWAQFYGFAPMPRFVVSHGVVPSMESIVANLGTAKGTEALAPLRPALFANLEGTSPDIFDPDNFAAFNIRYKIRFMNQNALTTSSLSYDATLAAIFAMVTTDPARPMTGTAIADGMASLADPDGTPISFSGTGLSFIQTARNQLAAGSTVDLQGVSGALDWNPRTGELRANILGWALTGSPDNPTLTPARVYQLNPAPATDGVWVR